jgi:hypothetical protein
MKRSMGEANVLREEWKLLSLSGGRYFCENVSKNTKKVSSIKRFANVRSKERACWLYSLLPLIFLSSRLLSNGEKKISLLSLLYCC